MNGVIIVNIYEMVLPQLSSKIYIIEVDGISSQKSKRYYYLSKIDGVAKIVRVNSIGTLVEFCDKYNIELSPVKEREKLIDVFKVLIDALFYDQWIKEYDELRKHSKEKRYSSERINWLNKQKKIFNGNKDVFNREQVKKLLKLGLMPEGICSYDWFKMFSLVSIYINKYGHIDIPIDYRTKNGYEEDPEGYRLGLWLEVQRYLYKANKFEGEKKEKLKLLFTYDDQLKEFAELLLKEDIYNSMKVMNNDNKYLYKIIDMMYFKKLTDYFDFNGVINKLGLDAVDYKLLDKLDDNKLTKRYGK